MSGWDTSSRPSWDRPDGPEDGTQAFSAPDLATGADDAWSAPPATPPDYLPGYGQQQEPPRPSSGQPPDLPRRGRHHVPAPDPYGRPPARPPWEDGPRQEPDQGFARPRFEPREPGRADAERPGWGQQVPSGDSRLDNETAARMDPALQDFFAPQQPRTGTPPASGARRVPGATLAGSGLPGGQRLPGANGPRPAPDPWSSPQDLPAVPPRGDAHPRPREAPPSHVRDRHVRDSRVRDSHVRDAGGGGRGRIIAVAAVVAVVVVVAAYLLLHKSSPSNTAAGSQPTVSASTPAARAKPTAKPTASKAASGPVYTLSAPATAGGYPIGQDPDFLAATTLTAKSVVSAVAAGGGGTVQGNPVSAAYQLPIGQQVLGFVGYQGTFTPSKVAVILAALGSDPHSYPAGPHGGVLGCANAPGSPSAAVCVWATTSTLGVTEFFEVSGPETLTTSEQSAGAQIVVNLRSGVETARKS